MRAQRKLWAAWLWIGMAAPLCLADTVYLKNGEEIEGRIVSESTYAIVVRDKRTGALRSIRRSNVDVIVYDRDPWLRNRGERTKRSEPPAKSTSPAVNPQTPVGKPEKESPSGPKPAQKVESGKEAGAGQEAPAGKEGEAAPEGEAKGEESDWPELPEKLQKAVDRAMPLLDSNDPAERADGKAKLAALGEEIIPALIKGLNHRRTSARAACADLLGDMRALNAMKHLIEIFYAAMPEKGQAATYQRVFIRSLKTALTKITGYSYINVQAKSPCEKPLGPSGAPEIHRLVQRELRPAPPAGGRAQDRPHGPRLHEKDRRGAQVGTREKELAAAAPLRRTRGGQNQVPQPTAGRDRTARGPRL